MSDDLFHPPTYDEARAMGLLVDEGYEPEPEPEPEPKPEPEPQRLARKSELERLENVFGRWLVMKDFVPLRTVLAAIAAHSLGGDAFGLVTVGGSGTAKTVVLEACSGVEGVVVASTLTGPASLLSATPRKEKSDQATGGLLREVGDAGILALKDFTSLLSLQRDARAELFRRPAGNPRRPVGSNGWDRGWAAAFLARTLQPARRFYDGARFGSWRPIAFRQSLYERPHGHRGPSGSG